jgi:uncharacterized protein (DUF169 family)
MRSEQINEIRDFGLLIKSFLNIQSFPVGVKFLESEDSPSNAIVLNGNRYCQALMKARNGEKVILDRKGISCQQQPQPLVSDLCLNHSSPERALLDLE